MLLRRQKGGQMKTHNGKVEDLGFGSLGNGITVWDKTRERSGDYAKVAHIATDRKIEYTHLPISEEQRAEVERYARQEDPRASTTQETKVFNCPPLEMSLEEFLVLNRNEESYHIAQITNKYDKTFEPARRDLQMFYDLVKQYDQNKGPRVGDFLHHPLGYTRLVQDWGYNDEKDEDNGIQTGVGSFHLSGNYISHSGSCDPSIKRRFMKETTERRTGMVWSWHNRISGAHRGVNYRMPSRVFDLKVLDKIEEVREVVNSFCPKVVQVTQKVRDYALEVLPPIGWTQVDNRNFFAMGEAYSHRGVVPTYYCFISLRGKNYCTIDTIEEAKATFMKVLTAG